LVDFRKPKWCRVASTTITAPSTIKPKSIAQAHQVGTNAKHVHHSQCEQHR
jgi:hypothetical protein